MNSNINILDINKYFLPNKNIEKLNIRNKIVNYSNKSINEANICHKIKKIPFYTNYFSILIDLEELNVSQLNENIIEQLKNIEQKAYFLFKYNDKNSINFTDYIYNSKNIKKLIYDCINTFQHILQGLLLLNKNNICFFNISPNNILFLNDYREKPVLYNFSLSLNLNKLDKNYILNILNNFKDFTYLPIEVHFLYYILKNNLKTITYNLVEEFCENFIENFNILWLFPDKYKTTYKEYCLNTFQNFINIPINNIINDILERNNKWDIYSISILYFQLFGCILKVFSLKETFINKIIIELSKNIHPDSNKRYNIEDTINLFNKFLNDENWQFINKLDNNKFPYLLEYLSN